MLCVGLWALSLAGAATAVGGRFAVVGREETELDLACLASDSRRPIGGEPNGDRPKILSALFRDGGRWAFCDGARGLALK